MTVSNKLFPVNVESRGARKLDCANEEIIIAQQVASEVVGKNWLVNWKFWAFQGSQSLFLIFTKAVLWPELYSGHALFQTYRDL